MNDQSTPTGKATVRPTIKQLIRNLEQAAWASGTDEYRDGVSDAACIRRGNEQAAARNALEEVVSRREAAWQGALEGLSRRDLVGWGSCWCDRNPASANIVDHESKCSAARAALADAVSDG